MPSSGNNMTRNFLITRTTLICTVFAQRPKQKKEQQQMRKCRYSTVQIQVFYLNTWQVCCFGDVTKRDAKLFLKRNEILFFFFFANQPNQPFIYTANRLTFCLHLVIHSFICKITSNTQYGLKSTRNKHSTWGLRLQVTPKKKGLVILFSAFFVLTFGQFLCFSFLHMITK